MKSVFRLLKYLVVVFAVSLIAAGVYVSRTWDRVYEIALPEIHASTDPAIIQRGEYLVYGPAHCVECHTSSYEFLRSLAPQPGPTGEPTVKKAD